MCRLLPASRSGYTDCVTALPRHAQRPMSIWGGIQRVYDDHKGRLGSPRIARELRNKGQRVGKNRIARLMHVNVLRAKAARQYKATTHSAHNLPVALHLLNQDFSAKRLNQKGVTDMTYLATDEGWLYLAVVLDLYARKVAGWAMSERLTAKLTCDALRMALWRCKRLQGVIVYSDRNSQYCAHDYRRLLRDNGLIARMSKKGDCYDNAAMESGNHNLKVEAIHGERFPTWQDASNHVFDCIAIDYNRKRLHSGLGYLSPEAFERQHVA